MAWPKGKRRAQVRRKPQPQAERGGEEAARLAEGETVGRPARPSNGDVLMTREGVSTEVHPGSVELMAGLGWTIAQD